MQSCHSLITHVIGNCALHISSHASEHHAHFKGMFHGIFQQSYWRLENNQTSRGMCTGYIHVLYVSTLYDSSKGLIFFTTHCLFKVVHNPGGLTSVILTNFSLSAMDAWGWGRGGEGTSYT
jgi:hypothetical protein